jgi:hypothetical protein
MLTMRLLVRPRVSVDAQPVPSPRGDEHDTESADSVARRRPPRRKREVPPSSSPPRGGCHDGEVASEPVSMNVQLVWPSELPAPVVANQFAIQVFSNQGVSDPPMILLTLGFAGPPLFTGTESEQRTQFESLSSLLVHGVGRYALTRDDLRRLISVLQQTLDGLRPPSPIVDLSAGEKEGADAR